MNKIKCSNFKETVENIMKRSLIVFLCFIVMLQTACGIAPQTGNEKEPAAVPAQTAPVAVEPISADAPASPTPVQTALAKYYPASIEELYTFSKVQYGMTKEQVKAIWGEPQKSEYGDVFMYSLKGELSEDIAPPQMTLTFDANGVLYKIVYNIKSELAPMQAFVDRICASGTSSKLTPDKMESVQTGWAMTFDVIDYGRFCFFYFTRKGADKEVGLEICLVPDETYLNDPEPNDAAGDAATPSPTPAQKAESSYAYITKMSMRMDGQTDISFDYVDWLKGKAAREMYQKDNPGATTDEVDDAVAESGYIRNTNNKVRVFTTGKDTTYYMPDKKKSVKPVKVNYDAFRDLMFPAAESGDTSITFVKVTVLGDAIVKIEWVYMP